MFIIMVHKKDGTTCEYFANAVDCAKSCIESVLHDRNAQAVVEGDKISVTVSGTTESELRDMVKGCFCDSTEALYPEFRRIELLSEQA